MKKTYAYHNPSAGALDKISRLRKSFSSLDDIIRGLTPASREQSVAITHLETAAMWAIKAIVCNDPESQVDLPSAQETGDVVASDN